jgi:peptidoglycan/LPS O-acetylase OafA/YrhL
MGKVLPAGRPAWGYRPALDGLRALAILAVVIAHNFPPYLPAGILGVDLFFVLSGFLITTILYQEWRNTGAINLRQFYARRALRLFPALAVLVLVCCVGSMLCCSKPVVQEIRKAACGALFYYSNWRSVRGFLQGNLLLTWNVLLHTWSLSVEEQFYLLWPLLLCGLLWLKVGRRRLAALLVGGIVGVTALRVYLYPTWRLLLYFRSDARADGLLVGCLAALLYCWGILPQRRVARVCLQAAAVAALVVLCWQCRLHLDLRRPFLYYGGFTLVAVETAVVLLAVLAGPPQVLSWLLEFPVLVWIGRVSYGMYLWHFPIMTVGNTVLGSRLPWQWVSTVNVTATFLAAALSFYGIERPFLRLKDRLQRKTAAAERQEEETSARPQIESLPPAA